MNRERTRRREEIAVAMMAGLLACPDVRATESVIAEHAIKCAEALMSKLDEAVLADTPDADPLRQLAELQDLQAAKEAAVERSVNKSILIWQRDRQIADLEDQLAALRQQAAGCEKLAALTEFAEAVRGEAHGDPELYGPFVALVRDLDAKVGAK